jgi:hypothetical protein
MGSSPQETLARDERQALEDLLKRFARIDPFFHGLAELVFADGPTARADSRLMAARRGVRTHTTLIIKSPRAWSLTH